MTEARLSGFVVLMTRPEHQADELVAAIEDAGGEVIRFPVIDIEPQKSADVSRCLDTLPAADIAIFISTNAVIYGLHCANGDEIAIAAIGPGTKSAIELAGKHVDIFPLQGYDSEHLLAEAELQHVAGKNIRIIRGENGRELLADTLRKRGAKVDYMSVYRRLSRTYTPNILASLERRWRNGQVNCVIAMSVSSLNTLLEILPTSCRELLDKTPLATPSARVLQTASDTIPNTKIWLADNPQTDGMIRALIACRQAECR